MEEPTQVSPELMECKARYAVWQQIEECFAKAEDCKSNIQTEAWRTVRDAAMEAYDEARSRLLAKPASMGKINDLVRLVRVETLRDRNGDWDTGRSESTVKAMLDAMEALGEVA